MSNIKAICWYSPDEAWPASAIVNNIDKANIGKINFVNILIFNFHKTASKMNRTARIA